MCFSVKQGSWSMFISKIVVFSVIPLYNIMKKYKSIINYLKNVFYSMHLNKLFKGVTLQNIKPGNARVFPTENTTVKEKTAYPHKKHITKLIVIFYIVL